ncbi:TPA: hypothetical protein ACPIDV_005727, partial [Pseudomonas aeruginosa]
MLGSVAIGDSSQAESSTGLALGVNSKIDKSSDSAISIGVSSKVKNADSGVAIGTNAVTEAKNSVAIGANSIADEEGTVSIGSQGKERKIVNLAAGTLSTNSKDAVNGSQLF